MHEHTARRGVLMRARRLVGTAIAVTAALVAASVTGSHGTHAAWNDAAVIAAESVVTSGTPGLGLSGVGGLDFEYEVLALTTSATVSVTNTGNTTLHSFEASQTIVEGSTDLAEAISVTFTGAGQTDVGIDDWLDGLTLAPGASAQYTATTTLPALDLALLAFTDVQIDLEVEATAGTSWNLLAIDGFAQAVLEEPQTQEDFNTTIVWPVPWPSEGVANFGFTWGMTYQGTDLSGSHWLIFTDGYEVSEDHGTYPQYSMHAGEIQHLDWPAIGASKQLVITVLPDIPGWTTPIAQFTVWMLNVNDSYAIFFLTDPSVSSSSAALPQALSAPAPLAGVQSPSGAAPAPTPQPTPPPAATAAPAPAPASTPEPQTPPADAASDPTETAEPAEPGDTPAATQPPELESTPESTELPQVVLTVAEQPDGTLLFTWPNPTGVPDMTTYRLRLNDVDVDIDLTATPNAPEITLDPSELPDGFWASLGDDATGVHEVSADIVAELPGGGTQTIATGTIVIERSGP